MIKTIYVDSTGCPTDLCKISGKYNTDKSPFSENSACAQNRKGFTAVYEMLFGTMRNKHIDLCEIGIEQSASLQAFSEYFDNVTIIGMEYEVSKIEHAKTLNMKKVQDVIFTDIRDIRQLNKSFAECNRQFDIIIDDSTHILKDQKNFIKIATNYLKSGGIIVIEDLYRSDEENIFDDIDMSAFSFNAFVICHHDNRHCPDNDKIWFGIKK